MALSLSVLSLLFVASLPVAKGAASAPLAGASGYQVVNKFQIPGEGGWDFIAISESTQRLFVSHGTQVDVVDAKKGTVVGTIPDTKGVHGVAIAEDLKKGFVSNGKDASVTIFDLETLKVLAKVPVTGENPDAILYDNFSHQVFAFNGRSANATVIDAKKNTVVSTLALEGKPEVPVSDGKGRLFVNIEDKSLIAEINVKTLKIEQRWSVSPGSEPSGLALDTKNHRLFIVCSNKLMVMMDSRTGKVLASLPIGDRVDGVAFDPGLKRAFSSNGEGTLTVVEESSKDSFKVLETLVTQKGARTIVLSTKTHHLYLPTAEFGDAPPATPENRRARPAVKPGTFVVLDIAPTSESGAKSGNLDKKFERSP